MTDEALILTPDQQETRTFTDATAPSPGWKSFTPKPPAFWSSISAMP